jgi:asparagine synthase (glutamine-hydrolysing)
VRATGCFEPKAVEKLVAKCRAGRIGGFRDNAAFVGILSTQLWHRAFAPAAAMPSTIPSAVA